jgi:hypothetical protein
MVFVNNTIIDSVIFDTLIMDYQFFRNEFLELII